MRHAIWIIIAILIIFRFFTTRPAFVDGQKIRITQKVLSQPITYDTAQYLSLSGLKVYLPLFPEVSYGDEVVVEGIVQNGQLKTPKLIKITKDQGMLFILRKKLIDFFQENLPTPESSLVAGVTIGSKSGIPQSFWENLKKTGTAHVIVASGTNVTMVANFLISILILIISRRKAIFIALIGVWIYCLLAGLEAPIIRAGIMGSIIFLAQATGRLYDSFKALLVTAAIMLFLFPGWIIDVGFILSFAATGSLILFGTKINKKLHFVPAFFREGLSTSLAAQIGVAPILFVVFGQFNILSPAINALVLWTIPIIMLIGGVSVIIGLIIPFLGKIALLLSYPLAHYFVIVINFFGAI